MKNPSLPVCLVLFLVMSVPASAQDVIIRDQDRVRAQEIIRELSDKNQSVQNLQQSITSNRALAENSGWKNQTYNRQLYSDYKNLASLYREIASLYHQYNNIYPEDKYANLAIKFQNLAKKADHDASIVNQNAMTAYQNEKSETRQQILTNMQKKLDFIVNECLNKQSASTEVVEKVKEDLQYLKENLSVLPEDKQAEVREIISKTENKIY